MEWDWKPPEILKNLGSVFGEKYIERGRDV